MKTLKILLFFIIIFPVMINALDKVPREIIVKTSQPLRTTGNYFGLQAFDDFLAEKQVKNVKRILPKSDNRYFVVSFKEELDWNEIKGMEFDGIEYIQPNYLNEMFIVPNDPEFQNQQLGMVNIPEAWNFTTGDMNIIIGLVDSGALLNHPDLVDNIMVNQFEVPDYLFSQVDNDANGRVSLNELIAYLAASNSDYNEDDEINYLDVIHENSPFTDNIDQDENGYIDDIVGWDFVDAPDLEDIALGDFRDPENDPTDENNHGTHVAGVMAAKGNNNEGISGVCWTANLLIMRAGFRTEGSSGGYLQDDDAAAAIIYAADMGADVINLSWGDVNFSQIIADACNYAYEKGSIIVVAAGNTGSNGVMYPARLSNTISVGSVDKYGEITSFSSYGPNLDLMAPGQFVISTYGLGNDLYKELSGTSVSAPFVTASVALLLSKEPQLNFEQVKARLNSTTFDLGDPGFDILYGNGLLNAYDMIVNSHNLEIGIDSPPENSGQTEDFDLIGTVKADNFWKYSVMYTTKDAPHPDLDWYNVSNHENLPVWYEEPVEHGVLATFNVSPYFPDDKYLIRIEMVTNSGVHYDYRTTVFIDQSPPVFIDSLAAPMKRYDAETPVYYIQAVYDEPVNLRIDCHIAGQVYPVYGAFLDSIQVVKLPENLPNGECSFELTATNVCGLESVVDFPYTIEIDNSSVDVNLFVQEILGNEMIATKTNFDIDGNGRKEFLGLESLEDDESVTGIFEVVGSPTVGYSLEEKHIFGQSFYPHDLGYANPDFHLDVMGTIGDSLALFEADTLSLYPTDDFIWTIKSVYGSALIDYDEFGPANDGIQELAAIHNMNVLRNDTLFTAKVISLNRRTENSFNNNGVPEYVLLNPTTSKVKNDFVNQIVLDNLDGDSFPDLLAADYDGDIMIFEINPEMSFITDLTTMEHQHFETFDPVWLDNLPVTNAFYLAAGNFTGHTDNIKDFCIGGFIQNLANPAKSFSYFRFYQNNGYDNRYEIIGDLSFDDVEKNNSIAVADLNGDGDDEIVLSLPPNLYVVDYVDGQFIPIWRGESAASFSNVITAVSQSETENSYILVDVNEGGTLKSGVVYYRNAEDLTGPPTPGQFKVMPIDQSIVSLSWENLSGIDYYNIYRKYNNTIQLIDSTEENSYLDVNLPESVTPGDTIYYQITSYSENFIPHESLPSLWKQAVPNYIPQLLEIEMNSDYELKLQFDIELANDAINTTHYQLFVVDSLSDETRMDSIGLPTSGIFTEMKTGILLRFRKPIPPQPEEEAIRHCYLNINGVTGATGVPLANGNYEFQYKLDTNSPYIVDYEIIDRQTVKIIFSEPLDIVTAEDISNFRLETPLIDADNKILETIYQSEPPLSSVVLEMKEDLKYSNQPYFLRVFNVTDTYGNEISNSGNKCQFYLSNIKNLDHMIVYPNPVNVSKETFDQVNFINLPLEKTGELKIFNLNGDLVYEEKLGPYHNASQSAVWRLENKAGKQVSSGMYFYVIKMGKDIKRGKVAVIN